MSDPDLHGPATWLAIALFSGVWLGLATNIRKISRRTQAPPRFDAILNAAHLGRFGGWALIGAAALSADPWTAWMLMATRIPAVGMVLVTFRQRRALRPPPADLLRFVGLPVLGLIVACGLLAVASLPAPASAALHFFVAACFGLQILYALPRQIWNARTRPLGNLRYFQLSLLANYAFMLLYSGWVRDSEMQLLMRVAYGFVFVEQAVLVLVIERGIRAWRRAGCPPPETLPPVA